MNIGTKTLFGALLFITLCFVVNGESTTGKKSPNLVKNSLITINEDDWDQMLVGEWMVELCVRFGKIYCPLLIDLFLFVVMHLGVQLVELYNLNGRHSLLGLLI